MKRWKGILGKLFLIMILAGTALGYQANAFAEPVSLLGGKVITPGKNPGAPLTTTTFVTDNDESTYFAVKPEKGSDTITDFLIYNFSSPQDIDSFKLNIKDYSNQNFAIGFRDSTGKEQIFYHTDGLKGGDNNIYQLPTPMKDVKIAFVWNHIRSAPDLNVIEWDLYSGFGTDPTATPEPTVTPDVTATPEPTITPTPTPTATPSPTPEQPTGDRAILVVTMNNGLEKEFDLSMEEVNSFITWYENKQGGTGTASFAINKHDNNKGPFTSRKDYVIFDKILTFSVDEYSAK